jgi:hypothetical protein
MIKQLMQQRTQRSEVHESGASKAAGPQRKLSMQPVKPQEQNRRAGNEFTRKTSFLTSLTSSQAEA